TLVEDIGRVLGCGAHVTELRRLASLPFRGQTMYSLQALEQTAQSGLEALDGLLLPVERGLPAWPEVVLDPAMAACLQQGQAVRVPDVPTAGLLRLYAGGQNQRRFLGVGRVLEDGRIGAKRLIFGQ
ncbi:MAG TPA: tRNA pseudouridine(55) synthase TruB, partial [Gammaproteobacteria bacterium]